MATLKKRLETTWSDLARLAGELDSPHFERALGNLCPIGADGWGEQYLNALLVADETLEDRLRKITKKAPEEYVRLRKAKMILFRELVIVLGACMQTPKE